MLFQTLLIGLSQMGYADGMNPRSAARRLVQWLKGDVVERPPTFAHEARKAKQRMARVIHVVPFLLF